MSATNPLLTNLLPGNNPTGNTLTLPYGTAGAPAGQNPMMPSLPSGTNASTVNNPYSSGVVPHAAGVPATAPTNLFGSGTTTPIPSSASTNTASGATGVSPIGQELGVPSTDEGENKTLLSLNKTFGAGLGTAIYNFLAGGAGFSQDAINAQFEALQPGYNQDQQNLLTQFGSTGNRFSSGAQIGESNLMGQQMLSEGAMEAQEYESAVTNYINVLMGATAPSATRKAQPSFLDNLLSGAADAAGIAGGLLLGGA